MEALQLRLEDNSAVMKAAEGLTGEQRLLAYDTELSAQIKNLTEQRDDVRKQLKEWYAENVMDPATGEVKENAPVLSCGPIVYAPVVKANWTYDVPAFIKKLGKKAPRFLKVSGETVTKAIESKEFTAEFFADVRTNTPTVTHGTKVQK